MLNHRREKEMIKLQLSNVMKNSGNYGSYFEIQLLPQIGFIKWYKTKKDCRKILGIYFVWIFWSVLFYYEKRAR